jgi:tripartite-type tricarboxylate transporter receptor subunit TctC
MLRSLIVLASVLGSLATAVHGQGTWPARPVRLIVPTSPGGATDSYARLLSQALAEAFRQQFIVDNRPGAGGNIGAEIVAKSPVDGYIFLVSSSGPLVINPSLYKGLSYSAERDLAAVARGVVSPIVFTSHPAVPAKTLPALVALAKREPNKFTYGSPGSGSPGNLAVKMLEESTGAHFVHLPYKGAGQAIIGLLRGESMFMVLDINTARPYIQSGRIVALAASHSTPQLPGIPTVAEAGYPKVDSYPSFSVTAPTGTSVVIIERLAAEIMKAMKTPVFSERLNAQSLIPIFDTPAEFGAVLKKERARYTEIIRRNKITVD